MSDVEQGFLNEEKLPLVLEAKKEGLPIISFLQKNEEMLKEGILRYGGVLLRGFPVKDEKDFEKIIEALNLGKSVNYIGGDSPRTKVRGGIYTSTEAPPSVKIPLHNELSFVKFFPRHIYFFCEHAPHTGGETILGDARKIYSGVHPAVVERFAAKEIKYVSSYYYKSLLMEWVNSLQPSHKTWRDVFETEDKSAVELLCCENEFAFQWLKNDWLRISQQRPPVLDHPVTKERVWFNQVHLYDFNPKLLGWWRYIGAKLFYARKETRLHEVFYADGSRIPRRDIYHLLDVLDANTVKFPWHKGDVLILDNMLAMHGRAPFTGKRRVLAAMTA